LRNFLFLALGFGILNLGACAGLDAEAGWVKEGPLTRMVPSNRSLLEAGEKAQDHGLENAGKSLTLREAIRLALTHNDQLRAEARKVRAWEHRRLQEGRWANPVLEVAAEDWLGSSNFEGVDQIQITAQFSQDFDIGGKRSARSTVAAHERDAAGWALELARLALWHRTALSFADVLVAQRELTISQEEIELANQSNAVFQAQSEAGRVAGMEVERAQIGVALAQLNLQATQLELERARQKLASCWGAPVAHFGTVAGEMKNDTQVPSIEVLMAGLDQHPRIKLQQMNLDVERARVEAARAEGVPDLSFILGYRYFNEPGDSALVAGLALPVPLFDRNQDAVDAAHQDVSAAQDKLRAAKASMGNFLTRASGRLRSAQQAAKVLAGQVLPQAEKTFQSMKEGARIGRFGYLDLLDAQRTLFRVKRQSLQAKAEAYKAQMDLEYFLAKPMASPPEGAK